MRRIVVTLGVVAIVAVAAYFARDTLKLLGPPERCWEIKESGGYLYKSNPCTGQFILLGEVPPKAVPSTR